MRFKLFTVLVATTALLGIGAQAASAKVPPQQMSRFHAIEGPYSAADGKWTAGLEALSPKSTVAQVTKLDLAFIPALKTFDAGLLKVGFTGKAAADAAAIAKLNNQLIGVLSPVHSLKSFETGFSALLPKFQVLQDSLAKDLGIPAGDVYI